MAGIALYVVSSVFLVLIGSLPCKSIECTKKTITDCYQHKDFSKEFCISFADMVHCLQEIEPECDDDKLIEKIAEMKDYELAHASKCPGMSANCYMEAKMHCSRSVPINVKTVTNYRKENYEKDCRKFKGKENDARRCFEELKEQCNNKVVDKNVAYNIGIIDEIEEKCKNYI